MQTTYEDGSETIGLYSPESFQKAIDDPKVKKIQIHKPGSIIEMSDRSYIVMPNGEWRRHT